MRKLWKWSHIIAIFNFDIVHNFMSVFIIFEIRELRKQNIRIFILYFILEVIKKVTLRTTMQYIFFYYERIYM